ncbi:hypothetical protein SMICM304S_09715 [Streptomyces microflavus]
MDDRLEVVLGARLCLVAHRHLTLSAETRPRASTTRGTARLQAPCAQSAHTPHGTASVNDTAVAPAGSAEPLETGRTTHSLHPSPCRQPEPAGTPPGRAPRARTQPTPSAHPSTGRSASGNPASRSPRPGAAGSPVRVWWRSTARSSRARRDPPMRRWTARTGRRTKVSWRVRGRGRAWRGLLAGTPGTPPARGRRDELRVGGALAHGSPQPGVDDRGVGRLVTGRHIRKLARRAHPYQVFDV